MVGDRVWSGRFPGANSLGCPAVNVAPAPRLWSRKPDSPAPISDDGQLRMDEFERLLSERTKLVAVASISNVLGVINPHHYKV